MKYIFLKVDPCLIYVQFIFASGRRYSSIRSDTRKNKQGKPESQVTGRHLSIASRECDTALGSDRSDLATGHKAPFSLTSDNFTFISAEHTRML
jgi:hypothetical protein